MKNEVREFNFPKGLLMKKFSNSIRMNNIVRFIGIIFLILMLISSVAFTENDPLIFFCGFFVISVLSKVIADFAREKLPNCTNTVLHQSVGVPFVLAYYQKKSSAVDNLKDLKNFFPQHTRCSIYRPKSGRLKKSRIGTTIRKPNFYSM